MMPLLMRSLLFILLYSMAFTPLGAQESAVDSPPAPPYLAAVPDKGHWIITFTYLATTAPGTPPGVLPTDNPVSVETTKVGTARRIIVKFAGKPAQQFDFLGNHYFAQGPLGLEYRTLDGDFPPYRFFSLGFPLTQCVNPGSFQDRTTYQNVPAFHYRDGSTEAWIAVDTRLPVGADSIGTVKTIYQFLPTPDADAIVLTPEEQKMLENQKKAEALYNTMR